MSSYICKYEKDQGNHFKAIVCYRFHFIDFLSRGQYIINFLFLYTINLKSLLQLLKGRVPNDCLVSLFFKYIGMKKTANILKTTLAVFHNVIIYE